MSGMVRRPLPHKVCKYSADLGSRKDLYNVSMSLPNIAYIHDSNKNLGCSNIVYFKSYLSPIVTPFVRLRIRQRPE